MDAESDDLIGRDRELGRLREFVASVEAHGGSLVVSGEPGVGKTALLDWVARHAAGRVLRVTGVESEVVLPFAVLADLLLPLRDRLSELPAAQQAAIETALALTSTAETHPFRICVGTLNLIAAVGERSPCLVLVDDLHWVDPSSRLVLLFLARRLSSERVGLIMTIRDDAADLVGVSLEHLEVPGLSSRHCGELLRAHGYRVSDGRLAELVTVTGGNPLALLETIRSLPPAQLATGEPVATWPSPGQRLERAWAGQLSALPETTRRALILVAASRSSRVHVYEAARAAMGLRTEALDAAEEAGLLRLVTDEYRFRHPVLRQLVLARSTTAQRSEAYRALAQVSSGALRGWYLAAGSTGPDEEAAQELARAAEEARRRSALAEAALAWHRAAELTTDPAKSERWLLRAGSDAFLGGAQVDVTRWVEQALSASRTPGARADAELLRGRVLAWLGHPGRAHLLLVQAAEAVREIDPARAHALLLEAVFPGVMDADVEGAVRCATAAFELTRHVAAPWRGSGALGQTLVLAGSLVEGRRHLEAAFACLDQSDPVADQQILAFMSQALNWADAPDAALSVLTKVIGAARENGAPGALAYALAVRGEIDTWTGRWSSAAADVAESLRWSEELGQWPSLALSLSVAARLDALRGDAARCEERIERARQMVHGYQVGSLEAYFTSVLGLNALATGDHQTAIEQFSVLLDMAVEHGLGNPNTIPFFADLVEANVRTGRIEQAHVLLDVLDQVAETTGLAWPAAASARCHVMLATDRDEADRWYAQAVDAHARRAIPFEEARAELVLGEVLRRFRRPAAAREPLASALSTFRSLGALPWVRRAAGELAATGLPPLTRQAEQGVGRLSPQELQVARAIAEGRNNVEAAAMLFVSRKTVEAHLTRIYRKLGIRSRTDLARILTSAGIVDGSTEAGGLWT